MDLPVTAATPEPPPPAAPTWEVPPEAVPDVTDLVIEDGAPVDSQFVAKLYKILTDSLAVPWPGLAPGRPYLALANVGLFHTYGKPPLVPDMMLSLDAESGDIRQKQHNAYFLWVIGKPPDLVVEIVSDRTGGELTHKFATYLRLGVKFYVVYDPRNLLKEGVLRAWMIQGGRYVPLEGPPFRFEDLGLQLGFWDGEFEGTKGPWLRWFDLNGNLLLTGHERAAKERREAEAARQDAQEAHAEADQARQEADQAQRDAERERLRRERLEAKLRSLGIDPEVNGEMGSP
jgi:hypothetical protein